MDTYSVTTRGLTVGYDGVPLIRDISVEIEKGQIVTLIGPNGSGKSTILKSLARQLSLIAGTVCVDGQDLSSLRPRDLARKMAVLLTERTRPELVTCFDVAAAGRYPYTGYLGILSPKDKEEVQKALSTVDALDLADRDFSAISDGQKQRVLLARALCQEPEIILLDEPTSFLDIKYKLELASLLRRMAREKGITVILSLHEIDLAQRISDRLMCVKGDTLFAYGAPEEIFTASTIAHLYGLEEGQYDPLLGGAELPRVPGPSRAFVLSSGGTGLPVYRRMQREGVPFAAGILFTNDADLRPARLLASAVVEVPAFSPIPESAVARALEIIRSVPRVLDTGVTIGEYNRPLERLREEARKQNKLIEV